MRPKSCQKLSFQKADIPLLLQFLSQVLERVCPDLNCAHYWQSALKCTHSLPLAGSLPLTSSHCINLRRKPFKQDMAKRGVAKGERRQVSAIAANACGIQVPRCTQIAKKHTPGTHTAHTLLAMSPSFLFTADAQLSLWICQVCAAFRFFVLLDFEKSPLPSPLAPSSASPLILKIYRVFRSILMCAIYILMGQAATQMTAFIGAG